MLRFPELFFQFWAARQTKVSCSEKTLIRQARSIIIVAQTTAKASTLTSTLTGHGAHDDELFISRPWLINKPVETGVLPWNLAQ